jgi:hypothetical protein
MEVMVRCTPCTALRLRGKPRLAVVLFEVKLCWFFFFFSSPSLVVP